MELIGVLEKIQNYIPSEYIGISQIITYTMPYIFLICSLITAFFGYKFHKFWARLTMTIIAFLMGAFLFVFFPQANINIFIVLGFVLAGITAYFSKYLYKAQIFIINFITAYIFIPIILNHFLSNSESILIGLILAVIIGIIAVKYKYIVTIITTGITGSILFVRQVFYLINANSQNSKIIYYSIIVVLAIVSCLFQFKNQENNEIYKKIQNIKNKEQNLNKKS